MIQVASNQSVTAGARTSREPTTLDSQTFEHALREHLPSLRRSARVLTHDHDAAEDLVQEASLRAFRFADRFEPGTHLRAWLHRILANVFLSERRRARREREILERVHREQPAPSMREPSVAEVAPELEQRIEALHPELRAVFLAIALDELSYRETAERLGCPIGTVMSRLHRARKALHEEACSVRARAHGDEARARAHGDEARARAHADKARADAHGDEVEHGAASCVAARRAA